MIIDVFSNFHSTDSTIQGIPQRNTTPCHYRRYWPAFKRQHPVSR